MKLLLLIKGEFVRLVKYKAIIFSFAVTAIWLIIIALLSKTEALMLTPLLILSDITIMALLLLAAMYYYEKQEGTLATTLITPVKTSDLVISKYITHIIIGLISVVLISLCNTIFHNAKINYPLILLYSIIIIINTCSLGYIIIFYSKDFAALLVNFSLIMLALFIPTLLYSLGIIPDTVKYVLFLSPIHCADTLILSTMQKSVELWEILVSIAYLIALSVLVIVTIISKKFKSYAMRG